MAAAGVAKVDEALTRKVADLARLDLTDAEVKTFTSQLGDILKYVDQLSQAKVDGIEPLTHPFELSTPFREDVVIPSLLDGEGKPKVLKSAPEVMYDGYKVPPIL